MWNKFRRVIDPRTYTKKQDLHVLIGEPFFVDIDISDAMGADEYPLDNVLVDFLIKEDNFSPEPVITKNLSDGIVIMDNLAGRVRVEITTDDTLLFDQTGGRLVYDVRITDDEGISQVVAFGNFYLEQSQY